MIDAVNEQWLAGFRQRYGRSPKVLHIGNIANNAYLNACILNRFGVDSDVLCNDYYHIMACPEWEAASFDAGNVDQNMPVWSKVDLGGFERPAWFAQGHLSTCLDYLIARRTGHAKSKELWHQLRLEQETGQEIGEAVFDYPESVRGMEARADRLVSAFAVDFPLRADALTAEEIKTTTPFYPSYFRRLRHLMSYYDVVVGYSTLGLYPLAIGKRPYFTYEHGTIRALPFEDSSAGRLCALTYSQADVSLITNCDNVIAAERLKLPDYRFIPHPINEEVTLDQAARLRQDLERDLNADFIAFHPSRHHWGPERNPNFEKGNDVFIQGFARFVQTARPGAAAVFVEWGESVERSKALLKEIGIADRIAWITPQTATGMAAYIKSSDVLADQFFLGAWGSTMPRALYFGTPAMIYVDELVHRWCFPEMPPIVNCRTPDQVLEGLKSLTVEPFRTDLVEAGRRWYAKYHSNPVIANQFLSAMRDHLEPNFERRVKSQLVEVRISDEAHARALDRMSQENAARFTEISAISAIAHETGRIAHETGRIASGFERRYHRMTAPLRRFLGPLLRVLKKR